MALLLALLPAGALGAPDSAAARAMPVPAGRALVYVYRPAQVSPQVSIPVQVNGQAIGSTLARTFFLLDVPLGALHLVSQAENRADLTFTAEAGERYYVLQEAALGVVSVRTGLRLMPAERGREGVDVSTLIRIVRL